MYASSFIKLASIMHCAGMLPPTSCSLCLDISVRTVTGGYNVCVLNNVSRYLLVYINGYLFCLRYISAIFIYISAVNVV